MHDPVTLWQEHLADELFPVIQAGVVNALPNDAVAIASATIRLGVELASQAACLTDATTAAYLRLLADALDAGSPVLPALCVVSAGRLQ